MNDIKLRFEEGMMVVSDG